MNLFSVHALFLHQLRSLPPKFMQSTCNLDLCVRCSVSLTSKCTSLLSSTCFKTDMYNLYASEQGTQSHEIMENLRSSIDEINRCKETFLTSPSIRLHV